MTVMIRLLLATIVWISPAIWAAQNDTTNISNPTRAFGYTVGDVLEQRIALQNNSVTYTIKELPVIQREGRWLARRHVDLDASGGWLTIGYQIINSPSHVRITALPALSLDTEKGQTIDVPAWSFSLAPLTPIEAVTDDSLPVMQADWIPETPSTMTQWRNIRFLSISLLFTLLLWITWWLVRNTLDSRTLPFARAFRAIRRHKDSPASEATSNWLALHRAFDQMNGASIGRDSIDELIQTAAWLKPFESDIRSFFTMSSMRFFASNQAPVKFDIADFSKRLYLAEKQHAGNRRKPSFTAVNAS